MANQEHVALLKQGSTVWNTWRLMHLMIMPDLNRVDLHYADLSLANLSSADLRGANLRGADLNGAILSKANLSDTNLRDANFSEANLSSAILIGADLISAHLSLANLSSAILINANLRGAILIGTTLENANLSSATLKNTDLRGANLKGADLSSAYLDDANLSGSNLSGATFHQTTLYHTLLAAIDLCTVKGLDSIIHEGPSYVDAKTVQLPEGETQTHFLRGVGFSDLFIDYYHSLFTDAIQYASCFISYAHRDEVLAERLYNDLQAKGVRCWFASHDLRPGKYIRKGIDEAIQIHETVLLLLSEHAVTSNWVEYEVEMTLERQLRERCDLLFPVRLDEAVMQAQDDWAARLRASRYIGDFTNWQDDVIYQRRFAELLRHLKVKTI